MWLGARAAAQAGQLVLVERRHPHVPLEGLPRVLGEQACGDLAEGLGQLLEQVEHPGRPDLDRGHPQVREAGEQAVGQVVGDGVL